MVSLLTWSVAFLDLWPAAPSRQATPPVRIVTMGVELPSGSVHDLLRPVRQGTALRLPRHHIMRRLLLPRRL